MLPVNIGPVDRALRVIVGLILLSLIFIGPQTLWGLVGLIPLGAAALGFCPVYTVLGIRTCPKE